LSIHIAARRTVRSLWSKFGADFRFEFTFVANSSAGSARRSVESVAAKDYSGIRALLDEILDAEFNQDDVTKPVTCKSEDVETLANHHAAPRELGAAIEGLNRLAREKAAKNPRKAA
jgi:hypothetical protein